ncbi:MAG: hypothetical protein ACHBN1_23705 [Heteroscytonema crispum UTEX LB 1556]
MANNYINLDITNNYIDTSIILKQNRFGLRAIAFEFDEDFTGRACIPESVYVNACLNGWYIHDAFSLTTCWSLITRTYAHKSDFLGYSRPCRSPQPPGRGALCCGEPVLREGFPTVGEAAWALRKF